MKKYLVLLFAGMLSLTSFAQDREAQYKTALIAHNKKIVSFFFDALERKDYSQLKNIIDANGKAVYAKTNTNAETIEGNESIRAGFQSYLDGFSKTDFQTEVIATEDPTLIMVKVKRDLEEVGGSKKETNYLATFKLKDGKIVEYVEYSAPLASHS
jgi:ketosteroid isomerase-like protein